MKKRFCLVFLLLVMVVVVLGGVAQAEKVKLRWMFHDSGPQVEKAVGMIYDQFIKENPDIEIAIEYVPWEVAMQTVMTMIKGNTLPDMGRVWPVDELGKMGALVPLEDLLTPEDLKHYTPAMKEALSAEDPSGKTHLYAMSNYQGTYALLVNKTLLSEAGLTTDDLATYESFESALQKLKKDSSGDGLVDRWGWTWSGSGSQNPWTSMEMAIYAFGGRLIKNLHMNSNVPEPIIINSPETVKALTWMTNVYKNGLVPSSIPTDTYEQSMEQFMTGQVVTLQEGPWSLSSQKEAFTKNGWELISAQLPKGSAGSTSFISFGDFGLFNTAQQRGTIEPCLKWLKYFTGMEGERIWCQVLGRIPNRPELQKEPFWTEDEAFKGFIAASATADREQPIWMTGLNRTIDEEAIPMFQGMLLGKVTPEDAAKQLQDIIVKGLTQFGVKLPE